MEEQIESRVTAHDVWSAWERVHLTRTQEPGKFKYKIFDIKQGESFSIVWKSLFVRLIFTHIVKPSEKGSSITYKVQIKGFFGWPVRLLLGTKIRQNVSHVLKSFVKELEHQSVVKSSGWRGS